MSYCKIKGASRLWFVFFLGIFLRIGITLPLFSEPLAEAPVASVSTFSAGSVGENASNANLASPTGQTKVESRGVLWGLVKDGAEHLAWLAGSILLYGVLWGGLFFLIGGCLGAITYYFLSGSGFFDHPWSWKQPLLFLWIILFFSGSAIGWAYGGFWFGSGRVLKFQIENERLLERIFSRLYGATCLEKAEIAPSEKDDLEKIERLMSESQKFRNMAQDDLFKAMQTKFPSMGIATDSLLFRFAVKPTMSHITEKLGGLDPVSLSCICLKTSNFEEYMQKNPDSKATLMLIASQFKSAKEFLLGLIKSFLTQNLVLGIVLGSGIPFCFLILFRLIIRFKGCETTQALQKI